MEMLCLWFEGSLKNTGRFIHERLDLQCISVPTNNGPHPFANITDIKKLFI